MDDMLNGWYIKSPDMPVISLFTGCGGMEIGLEMAGFRTAICVEIDKDCRSTVGLNRDWKFVLAGSGEHSAEERWGKEYRLERKAQVIGCVTSDRRPTGSVVLDDGRTVKINKTHRLRKAGNTYIVEIREVEVGYVRSRDKKRLRRRNGQMVELDEAHRLRRAPGGDITQLSTADILAAGNLQPGDAALVTGGAPCQPFSTIGEGLGVLSKKGNLFREFMRVVEEAQPMGFIFENVSGIKQKQHRQVIDHIRRISGDIGYSVRAGILNAADYGVPQIRKRFIVLGVRNGCGQPAFPYPTHAKNPAAGFKNWVTVGECFQAIHQSDFSRPDSKQMKVSKQTARRISYIKVGTQDNFRSIPNRFRPECWKDRVDEEGRQLGYQGEDPFGRLSLDKPSVTIRTRGYHPMTGRFLHPTEDRALNTIEMARLQGFPAEWRFHGGLESIGRQIGNAVPPQLAKALGEAFRQIVT